MPSFSLPAGRKIEAVVIGASAGGIDALMTLFDGLPASFKLPMIVLLHLPDERESRLAEIFQHRMAFPVREALDKHCINPGTLYFATAGYHLSIEHDRCFSLSCEPPVHFSRPSIDVLMESAAEVYAESLAGFLLTGANFDGAAGLKKIKQYGGLTVVQEPAEAQVAIMPKAAIALCQHDYVLPLADIRCLLLQLENMDSHGVS